jgi:hypothetical protein
MREVSLVSRFRSALHERLDAVAKEPLPKRWVDLIKELNERERRETRARHCRKLRRTRPH